MESSEVKPGVRLFGVLISARVVAEEQDGGGRERMGEEIIRKSQSMINLAAADPAAENAAVERGYLSEGGPRKTGRRRMRRTGAEVHERKKKGVPWTEEEHRTFLEGLEKLGKGDWRGISRQFVPNKTPTQVASHAQKYFIRQTAANGRRRRSSLFDVVIGSSSASSVGADVRDEGFMKKSTPREEDLAQLSLGIGRDGSIGPSCTPPGLHHHPSSLGRSISTALGQAQYVG